MLRATASRRSGPSLREAFEDHPNALHCVRVCLALAVVLWHAHALRIPDGSPNRLERVAGELPVDLFFAISGFLVCRSWAQRPDLRLFLTARSARLLPGLWVCLLVTAFVVAPLAAAVEALPQPSLGEQVGYVVGNAGVHVTQWDIAGGPFAVPHPGVWNGSLWSLSWEAYCYLGVALLGSTRLRGRQVACAVMVLAWAATVALTVVGDNPGGLAGLGARTALMFASGALVFSFADRLSWNARSALGAGAIALLGLLTPHYRLAASPALAFLVIGLALSLGRLPWLVFRNDLSYGVYIYSFPVQQLLLVLGLGGAAWACAALSVACVLPVAAASWILVERPMIRWARSRPRPRPAPEAQENGPRASVHSHESSRFRP